MFLATVAVGTSPAEDPPTVLAGLERLHVRVVHLSDLAFTHGVDEEVLVREVSLCLGRAGFLVLSALNQQLDGPFLAIALDAVELPSGMIVLHTSLELREDVILARDQRLASASTWYTSAIGFTDPASLPEQALETVLSLADDFLIDAGLLTD
jgi:hypothetical protein